MLEFIPAIANLMGWGLYMRGQLKGYIKANPVPWLMSLMIVLISGLSLANNTGSWMAGAMYFAGLIPCAVVFLLSIKNGFHPTKKELTLLVFAIICLYFSVAYPILAIWFTASYYIITYNTFIGSVVRGDSIEQALPWLVWVFAAFAQIVYIAYSTPSFNNFILPFINFICWGVVAYFANKTNKGIIFRIFQ